MAMSISEIYGSMVFNDAVMRQRLPKDVYMSLTNTIAIGKPIDVSIANVVANAMKELGTSVHAPYDATVAEVTDAYVVLKL